MTETKKSATEIDPSVEEELDKAADGLVDLLARVLAERHVAACMEERTAHPPEKRKKANP